MELAVEKKLTNVHLKASRIYADQKEIESHEEAVNKFLDDINKVKAELRKLFPSYEEAIESAYESLKGEVSKRDLVYLWEMVDPVFSVSNRLFKTMSSGALKECFVDENKIFKTLISDLKELREDLDKKINGNPEIESLLDEISKL